MFNLKPWLCTKGTCTILPAQHGTNTDIYKTSGGVNDPNPASSTNMCYIIMYPLAAKNWVMLRNTFIISVSPRAKRYHVTWALVINSGLQWNLFKWPDQNLIPWECPPWPQLASGFPCAPWFPTCEFYPRPDHGKYQVTVGSNATGVLKSKYEAHHKIPPNKLSTVDVNELNFSPC